MKKVKYRTVPESKRLGFFEKWFGSSGFIFETFIYRTADGLSEDYKCGYWDFYELEINGKKVPFVALNNDKTYKISNMYGEYEVNSLVFSLIVYTMALNHFGWFLLDRKKKDYADEFFEKNVSMQEVIYALKDQGKFIGKELSKEDFEAIWTSLD